MEKSILAEKDMMSDSDQVECNTTLAMDDDYSFRSIPEQSSRPNSGNVSVSSSIGTNETMDRQCQWAFRYVTIEAILISHYCFNLQSIGYLILPLFVMVTLDRQWAFRYHVIAAKKRYSNP